MPTRRQFLATVPAIAAAERGRAARGQSQPATSVAQPAAPAWLGSISADIMRLVEASLATSRGWDRLAELCDTFGSRLTGSRNLELAIDWAAEAMRRDGLDRVRLQPTRAPHWVRGDESLELVTPAPSPLVMLGLGGSVGTPGDGITAPLLVVRSFDELNARAAEARGRIVLFDVPFTSYGQTVAYRAIGPSQAARHGAVAALVRSVGPIGLRTPHTGALTYQAGVPQIPAAAIPVEDAQRLSRLLARSVPVTLRLRMAARTLPDADSANVIGEITGRERPEEVVLLGGHFDSWDPAGGASDDGVGCIVTWEAARLMAQLGMRPRRTVRVVLFTNEENGLRGGLAYRDGFAADAGAHVLALESDIGVFEPMRLGFTGNDRARQMMADVVDLLRPIGFPPLGPGGGGADIGPIAQLGQTPTMALSGDASKYFVIHHTPADTVERIDPREVAKAAAGIAAVAWAAAEMETPLPR
ncbi:peptidase M28 [Luteitalea sp. TBR-22]|uniref:M28 family peptidase n=1 Tax=Luteitalea sp. TBR-22 TaxID=2802971 RepID=UPI001AFA73DD|nr:M28 family peptidase [Luteitalea sp. TBR-22]BCS32789.1 peptidase M28 [Luteitalea sp. TBR-22]